MTVQYYYTTKDKEKEYSWVYVNVYVDGEFQEGDGIADNAIVGTTINPEQYLHDSIKEYRYEFDRETVTVDKNWENNNVNLYIYTK